MAFRGYSSINTVFEALCSLTVLHLYYRNTREEIQELNLPVVEEGYRVGCLDSISFSKGPTDLATRLSVEALALSSFQPTKT